ncbi:type III secretion system gatekeeper subunit SctW [Yersinia ruckeri]|uniref:type III secretion system gatekeeper subunit SctW n=1 Tax=Yersinia ruckeri TaxID=29486 RepID=UPI0008FE30ED|nr:type III secretion system gatekeeper subunit SctW [Yersinia ruckeri]OJB93268.1 hypothetical protein AXW59_13510 [Yersinia ruckeri]OJB96156.1 hypothetical protein AXW58_13485 [Yersinia ruckeri]OJC01297.1 hypothetical protein AXW57_13505 [Yersinia ruckeri]
MAISPLGGNSRYLVAQRDKGGEAPEVLDDAEETLRGQGVINNTSEYASMAMLASQFNRRKELRSQSEESSLYTDRILDDNADEKISHIEKVFNREVMTPKQLRSYLVQYFPDASDMLMAIFELLRRKKLTEKILKALNELKSQLQEEDIDRGTEAGVNVALSARLFSSSLKKSSSELRNIYREFICYDGPTIYIYEQWVDEIDGQQREVMLRYLTRALACDLQAIPTGNINVIEFGNLFRRVGSLRELHSAEFMFLQKIIRSDLIDKNKGNETALAKIFITGIRNADDYERILSEFIENFFSVTTLETKAIFIQMLITGFSTISVDLFFSLELRNDLIDLLKDYMSRVKQREEELAREVYCQGAIRNE